MEMRSSVMSPGGGDRIGRGEGKDKRTSRACRRSRWSFTSRWHNESGENRAWEIEEIEDEELNIGTWRKMKRT